MSRIRKGIGGGAIRPRRLMERNIFDLHLHSHYSDGSDTPAQVVRRAAEAGVQLLSLTDHDTALGVPEAIAAGKECGVFVLPGVELDTEFAEELHILGLGIDLAEPKLAATLELARHRREVRNAIIVKNLAAAGFDTAPHMPPYVGTVTRMHIARALVLGGYAPDVRAAFRSFLGRGCPGFHEAERVFPREAIALIRGADGVAVLAHPCHLKRDVHALVAELAADGLGGVEAYYATSTEGQTQLFNSLAAQHGLLVTAGSDYHGAERPANLPGCAWRDVPELARTFDVFRARM